MLFDVVRKVSRRQALAGIGAIGSSTVGVIALGSDTAKGQTDVSFGELEIPDKTYVHQNGSVESVGLKVNSSYEYASNYNPSKVVLTLRVGMIEAKYPIDQIELTDSLNQSDSGDEELSGDILSTPAFSSMQFERERGESTIDVKAKLTLEVYRENEVIGTSEAITNFQITASGEEITAETSIGGSGAVNVETN